MFAAESVLLQGFTDVGDCVLHFPGYGLRHALQWLSTVDVADAGAVFLPPIGVGLWTLLSKTSLFSKPKPAAAAS